MSRDIAKVFADIDAFDPDKFAAHLTPDAKFRFANADPGHRPGGRRRIEDDAAWRPRTFDPDEIGSIDMWLGPVKRVSSQAQLQPEKAGTPS
jgi:hypothetical protein